MAHVAKRSAIQSLVVLKITLEIVRRISDDAFHFPFLVLCGEDCRRQTKGQGEAKESGTECATMTTIVVPNTFFPSPIRIYAINTRVKQSGELHVVHGATTGGLFSKWK